MFTDTHCHISVRDYENIEEVIERAKEQGITKMINNATNRETGREVIEISSRFENVYPAIGFHPDAIDTITEDDYNFLESHIDKIVAIGEIGLDYHYEPLNKEKQIEVFKRQMQLAEKHKKPVIIHSRDATNDTIEILKAFPKVKGSIHCFTGSLETANIYIKLGYKLGLGGVTTFKNAKIKEVIKSIPLNSILLETDSPYLSPEPFRGHKNEPKNVYYIASFIAETKGITLEELSKQTEENTKTLFDI